MLRSLPKLSPLLSAPRTTNIARFLANSLRCASSPKTITTTQTSTGRIAMTTRAPIRPRSSSTVSSITAEDHVRQPKLLKSTDDDYDGVIVEMDQPMDATTFVPILRSSISHWKQLGKKGVWIKLPIHLVSLVEPLVKEGFWYHHAEPKYLMLVYWIPETPNTIPVNASHRVGIAAFVMNEKREVLVVQENSGHFRGTGVWKFPTGVVDQGEDICVAAVREVKEETGVDSEFVEVLAFRQSHKSFFDKSDLFFVCMMRPLSSDIHMQRLEIEAAQWMPFEEYSAQPFVQKHDLLKYISDICSAKIDGRYSGYSAVSTSSSFSDKKYYLYLNAGALKSSL
ncbi:nudix (nucleoside diphosphate linked moiety X)-type motif 2 [Stylosanthes scabra]|uniref:Nudix (Nucleoside diphosphate linked moiety X)-type motif 2 n=1 Tax=Stylosanthes scabra TaxID=79078 RepID=A0ABU6VFG6_9FABA|nr:nudix (nucleoside diphosphate linked moiety X)-type motif 2 [Stylosanthes scabra]